MKTNNICIPSRSKKGLQFNGKTYEVVDALPRIAGKIKDFLANKPADIQHSNYNGYGYQDHTYNYFLTKKEYAELKALTGGPSKPKKTAKTEAEKAQAWALRLAKLTGITIEEAEEIAEEKIAYKEEKINEMEDRQSGNVSIMRDKLINKMRRENPLRRIESREHAEAILAASRRHNLTDYESRLNEGRELAATGEIDKSEVKDYARSTCRK